MFLKYCRELEKKRRFLPAQHAEVPHARARTHGHAKTGRVKIRQKKIFKCAHAGDTQLFEGRIKSKMLSDYVP